jgi:hypothetical protein
MLAEPEEDGSSLLDHLLVAEARSGIKPQILADAPELPPGCEELWHIFRELHACRGNNGLSIQRITYADIDAFQRVAGLKLAQWELNAIRKADLAFIARWQEGQKKKD